MIRKHQFDVTEDNDHRCRHCGRLSRDPDLIRDLPCVEREGLEEDWAKYNLDPITFNTVTAQREYWTQSVQDSVLREADPRALYEKMENDARRQMYEKDRVPIAKFSRHAPMPMSTMPGYSILKITGDFVPAKRVELQQRLPNAKYSADPAGDARSVAQYLADQHLAYNDERPIGPDPVIRTFPDHNGDMAVKVTFWTLPARVRVVTPGEETVTW